MKYASLLAPLLAGCLLAGCKSSKESVNAKSMYYPTPSRTLAAMDESRDPFLETTKHTVTEIGEDKVKSDGTHSVKVGKKKYKMGTVYAYQDGKAYHRVLKARGQHLDLMRVYQGPLNIYAQEYKVSQHSMRTNITTTYMHLFVAYEDPKTHELASMDKRRANKKLFKILEQDPAAKAELDQFRSKMWRTAPVSWGGSLLAIGGGAVCLTGAAPVGLAMIGVGTGASYYSLFRAKKHLGHIDNAICLYDHLPMPEQRSKNIGMKRKG